MGITGATLTQEGFAKLLADGLKGHIQELMQDKLEEVLIPMLKNNIAENIEQHFKDFASYKLAVHEDVASGRVMVNVQFVEKKEC